MRSKTYLILTALVFITVSFVLSFWYSQDYFFQAIPPSNSSTPVPKVMETENQPQLTQNSSNLTADAESQPASGTQEYYISIFGDRIAVFQGKPGAGGVVVEQTQIPIAKIPEFEIRNLRAGIPFSTDEEKYSILEGLHFPQ